MHHGIFGQKMLLIAMIFLTAQNLWFFMAACFLLVATPGPAWIYIVTNTNLTGWKAGIASVIGLELGTLVHVFLGVMGLSLFINQSPVGFMIIRIIGAIVLIILGVQYFRRKKSYTTHDTNFKDSGNFLLNGMLLNIFNPKGILFFVSFLPQFIELENNQIKYQMVILGFVFISIALIWGIILTLVTNKVTNTINTNNTKVKFRIVAGIMYLIIGLTSLFYSF